jgi:hypothetical protein
VQQTSSGPQLLADEVRSPCRFLSLFADCRAPGWVQVDFFIVGDTFMKTYVCADGSWIASLCVPCCVSIYSYYTVFNFEDGNIGFQNPPVRFP